MAQRAGDVAQPLDVQQREQRAQHRHAAADDGLALGLDAGQPDGVAVARGDQLRPQPVQAGARDHVPLGRLAAQAQGIGHRSHRARAAVGGIPVRPAEVGHGVAQHGLRRRFGALELARRQPLVAEVRHGPRHAAQQPRSHGAGLPAAADDQLGRAPAHVQHQAPFMGGRQALRHAAVDQAGFFLTADDLDRKAQQPLPAGQKVVAVARLAQRLRGHGAHLPRRKPLQRLAKARQAVPAALQGLRRQVAVGPQPAALAHGFLVVVDALELPP